MLQEHLLRLYLAAVLATGQWLQHFDLVTQEYHVSHEAVFKALKQSLVRHTLLQTHSEVAKSMAEHLVVLR